MNKLILFMGGLIVCTVCGNVTSAAHRPMPDPALQVTPAHYSETISSSSDDYAFTLAGEGSVVNERLQLEVLEGVAVNPTVIGDMAPDFTSLKGIVGAVVTPDMSDEQKAITLWRFTMNNLYDGRWGTSLDALEQLDVYGYGYCGTFASVLEGLWWASGLKGRHVNIGNHAATEVYYDNAWHYLDAHRRCYFLLKDNKTIASLDDLNLLPELWDIRRGRKPTVGQKKYYYMTMHPNGMGRSPAYMPDFAMAKGDILTFTWQKKGKWCLARGEEGGTGVAPEPPIYANGTFRFYRNMKDSAMRKESLVSSTNVDWTEGGDGVIHPLAAGREAFLVYRVRTPFFVPQASVKGEFSRKGKRDSAALDISVDNGATWETLWSAENTGLVRAEVMTARTQMVTTDRPWKYSYLIRVRMNASRLPTDVGFRSLESVADLVYNPQILPKVIRGHNRFTYRDSSTGNRSLRVTHTWMEDLPVFLSHELPMEGEVVSVGVRVKNAGERLAQHVPVVLYCVNDGQNTEIGRKVIDSLNPGDTQIAVFPWKASRAGKNGDRHTTGAVLKAVVNPEHGDEDSDWDNNSFEITVPVLNPPDVRIPSGSFIRFDEEHEKGDVVRITATLRNLSHSKNYGYYIGDHATARDIYVRFFDGDPKQGRQIGTDQFIATLAPLETSSVSVPWNVKELSGRHEIFVQVSPPVNLVKALGARPPEIVHTGIDLDRYHSCRRSWSGM